MQLLIIVAVVLLSVQILYLGTFLYTFLRLRASSDRSVRPASIIVCAHDEEHNLRELIPLLLSQDHPQFEVIVVEDRSNDGTYDYLLEATRHDARLKMVRVAHRPEHISGKKFALTLGIRAAAFDWVVLTDADCRPQSPTWLQHMCRRADKEIVLGFSSYEKEPGLLNAFIRFETFLTGIQYVGFAAAGYPYMGVGRNLSYAKSLFIESKGFHAHLELASGDDDLFVNSQATRSNTGLSIGKDSLVCSKPKTSWRSFYYQKLRHLSAGRRYTYMSKFVLALFNLSWIGTWLVALPVAIWSEHWVFDLFLLRWTILAILFYDAPRKLGDRFEVVKVPLLDFIYAFYYLVAGLTASVSKKVRWRV